MLENHPKFKLFLHRLIIHPYASRPRLWARIFVIPFGIKRGKGSIIRRSARLDLIPSKKLVLGNRSIIEDYALLNNQMGDIIIGDNSYINTRGKIVGPVIIGNNVIMGGDSQITGLTHNYKDVTRPINQQGVTPTLTVIEDDVWIGGNSCIIQGIRIGTHSLIAAGSVVTKSVPPYTVVGGNPAKVIRRYDFDLKEWVKP
ncbi:acyltransferase [Parabacteroides sp. PF5-6]|uniref:acyltransferase n=1 Tax=Parabacteroides sp. PF5-6 TaxID=1742403 RepID=UPI002404F324|nr:acyltransferase [Parabacteroides sp. PF5-6]MDF9831734.1 acetyltransferase-like isoleucine patch superfamily enzyme [Parabacteroides sp. PF5-6]